MKGVSVSRNGSNVSRGPRLVAQRGTDFGHQVVQARVGDEGLWPKMLEELGLRNSLRPPIEKKRQELEGFKGKRRDASMAKKQTPAGVELALSKGKPH
jgi:hypothetical protein